MGIRAERGIDRVTASLPGIYRLLLELRHEEPRLAKKLTRKLKETIDLYQDLLRRLESDTSEGSRQGTSSAQRIEMKVAEVGELVSYSRKRALLRKQAILRYLDDKHPGPVAGAEIAEMIMRRQLADNAPTVTTHISRMKNEGLIRVLASGVFAITDSGRSELASIPVSLNDHQSDLGHQLVLNALRTRR